MTPKLRAFLPAVLIGVALDQVTKSWVANALDYGEAVPVIAGLFDLTHVRNPGASFSLFFIADPTLRLVFFGGLSFVAIGVIIVFYRQLEAAMRMDALALGLILAGAIGNLIDRVRYGEVIDFLRVHLTATYSWPDFNLADSFIVCGVLYLLADAVFGWSRRRGAGAAAVN